MDEYSYQNLKCLILDDVPEHIRTAKNTLDHLGVEYDNLFPADNQIEALSVHLQSDIDIDTIFNNIIKIITKENINLLFLDMSWNRHGNVETPGKTSGENFMKYLSNKKKFGQITIISYSIFSKDDIQTMMPAFHIQKNLGGIGLDMDTLRNDLESQVNVANMFKLVKNYDTITNYQLKVKDLENFSSNAIETKKQIVGFVCENLLYSDLVELKQLLQKTNDYENIDDELKKILDGADQIREDISKEKLKGIFYSIFDRISPYAGMIKTSVTFFNPDN